jgi:hypothetical protein
VTDLKVVSLFAGIGVPVFEWVGRRLVAVDAALEVPA